ncbi:MAG: hypothetical protein VSS75_017190 [Candidatus Parabeggiatoa sp.]|nr:hypothetical protein [Candidatus Parabeggiatoa sp.]
MWVGNVWPTSRSFIIFQLRIDNKDLFITIMGRDAMLASLCSHRNDRVETIRGRDAMLASLCSHRNDRVETIRGRDAMLASLRFLRGKDAKHQRREASETRGIASKRFFRVKTRGIRDARHRVETMILIIYYDKQKK